MIDDVKLVICDIDWTLLSRKKRTLSNYTLNVIEELHRRNIMFGLASGRPLDEVKPVYDTWGLSFPCDLIIYMNGGGIWNEHTKENKEFYKLKKNWIKEIVEITKPLNVNPYLYYHGAIKALKDDQTIQKTALRNNKKLIIAKDVDDFANEDNGKVMIRVKQEEMEKFERYISQYPSPHYEEFKTQETLMEFCDRRVSKGNALERYCDDHNIPLSSVMAFGDTTNDNMMIKNAGWGVCLLNGSDDTKQISDDITEYDVENDGFAHYVEKHILNN